MSNKITIPVDIFKNVVVEESDEEDFEVVEESGWDDQGKNSYQEIYLKQKSTGKIYQTSISRSGSYYTDYYYDWEYLKEYDAYEVVRKEITTTVWAQV